MCHIELKPNQILFKYYNHVSTSWNTSTRILQFLDMSSSNSCIACHYLRKEGWTCLQRGTIVAAVRICWVKWPQEAWKEGRKEKIKEQYVRAPSPPLPPGRQTVPPPPHLLLTRAEKLARKIPFKSLFESNGFLFNYFPNLIITFFSCPASFLDNVSKSVI